MRASVTLDLSRPNEHLIGVEMVLDDLSPGPLVLRSPEWIPGHYALMNNARFVQDLRAEAGGRRLAVRKVDKQTWEVASGDAKRVTVRYDAYAWTLSSSASFFDDTQCHVNGWTVFLYVAGRQDAPYEVRLRDVPAGWKVATALETAGSGRWRAATYDDLIDSPIKVGRFHHRTFRVRGKAHHVVLADNGDTADRLDRLVRDTKRFVAWLAGVFGGLPYDAYWFLYDLDPARAKGGALEHKASTHLALPVRLDSDDEDDYLRILAVACHEFFHLWNVKRIRPRSLGPFDYTREAHTTDLWVAEGLTDYYAWYALLRGGAIDPKTYLTWLGRYLDNLHDMPGRVVMTLREASWETWTQAFWTARHSAEETNVLNRFVDYYTKGAVVGALLDVEIRAATKGAQGLEDVFRALWKRAEEPEGFAQGEFEDEVERVAGRAVRRRLEGWIGATRDLPYASVFRKAGLRHSTEAPTKEEETSKRRRKVLGRWGIEVDDAGELLKVRNVEPRSPAMEVGLGKGDVLLAADGFRLSKDEWRRLLRPRGRRPLRLTIFRYDRLREVELRPRPDPRRVARFEAPPTVPAAAARVRTAWLGPVKPPFTTRPEPKPTRRP